MAKRVTLSQIGQRAGVSDVAVSAALGLLAKNSSVRLSPQKAQMIRRVAQEMGYQPNLLARAFRQQQTDTVGVLFRVVSNPLSVSYLIDCIHRELLALKLQVNLSPYQSSISVLHASVERMLAWRVDAVILCHVFDVDAPEDQFAPIERMLDKAKVPMVLVESTIPTQRPRARVLADLENATFSAATHLLSLGHRRLAYIGEQRGAASRRWAGVQRAIAQCPGAQVQWLTLEMDPQAPATQRHILAAVQMGHHIAQMHDRPTGLICNNDQVASAVMTGMKDRGLSVPADISITGYDDSDQAILCRPPLTTFRPPVQEMAAHAVQLLTAQLGRSRATKAPPVKLFQPELVVRQSTAAPPRH
jgi:LacI family transcriptional regulator